MSQFPFEPEDGLDPLRHGDGSAVVPAETSLARVSRDIEVRADPGRVAPARAAAWPWSRGGRAHRQAATASLHARLDIFQDDLRAIRIINEVLNRAATLRAVEAAEGAIFEIRSLGETARYAILNRAHLEMTAQFVAHLEALDSFRGRVSPEVLDALKERALNEYTARMNRASKADVEFARAEILKLKL